MSFTWSNVGSVSSIPIPSTPDIAAKKSMKFSKNPFSTIGNQSTSTTTTTSTINERDDDRASNSASLPSSLSSPPPHDTTRQHDFIRTHFHRATQCDFCGKKIWLKDAVQCKECGMSCHKKCINKCQNSTICGPVDAIAAAAVAVAAANALTPSVEFKVTDVDVDVDFPEDGDEVRLLHALSLSCD